MHLLFNPLRSTVINIFLGCILPAFHLEDSGVYVLIVYLLGIAAVVFFDLYLACSTASDGDNYRVLSRPDDDEVEVATVPARQTFDDIRKVRLFGRYSDYVSLWRKRTCGIIGGHWRDEQPLPITNVDVESFL